jgi:HEAT repeat protein
LITIVALVVGIVMLSWPRGADPESPDMNERLTAVSELVASTDQGALDTLTGLTGDAESRVAISAIRAIGSRHDNASRLQLMQIVAKNKNGVLRGTAAAELGNFEKTDYKTLVDILRNDKDPIVRACAARGLKRLHNAAAVPALVEALGDSDADVRGLAFEAIGRCTGRWFKFNPNASPAARAKAIDAIKKELAHVKHSHAH